MKHFNINLNSSVAAWLQIAALVFASFAPFMLSAQRVDAAQLDQRSIAISDSRVSAVGVTYTHEFYFNPGDTTTVADFEGYTLEFCSNSPIPSDACTATEGLDVPDFDTDNDGDVSDNVTLTVETDDNSGFASPTDVSADWSFDEEAITDTLRSDGTTLVIEHSTSANYSTERYVRITLSPVDATADIINPSDTAGANNFGSFYARLYADNDADAQDLTSSYEDDGGIAMSTVDTLTITARVQEVLEFCVGDTDAATTNDCDDISGNDIDMGVLDSTSVNTASAEDSNAYAMIRTNAANGATISYFADAGQDVNDDGGGGVGGANDTNDGYLSKNGADCTDGAASQVNGCINAVGATEAAIVAGTENFGMTISSIDVTNGTTSNLAEDAEYDTPAQYTFVANDLTADTIASSSTVLDDEMLVIDFGGTAAITTPTGVYNTSIVYIATSSF
ncbi:TPA: hypothetical protein EYO12_02570 [Candidatus Saccharibacteria bacterium]|nr:hypothetical protein [Candidatus Saccharibacteria bacterium]